MLRKVPVVCVATHADRLHPADITDPSEYEEDEEKRESVRLARRFAGETLQGRGQGTEEEGWECVGAEVVSLLRGPRSDKRFGLPALRSLVAGVLRRMPLDAGTATDMAFARGLVDASADMCLAAASIPGAATSAGSDAYALQLALVAILCSMQPPSHLPARTPGDFWLALGVSGQSATGAIALVDIAAQTLALSSTWGALIAALGPLSGLTASARAGAVRDVGTAAVEFFLGGCSAEAVRGMVTPAAWRWMERALELGNVARILAGAGGGS
jgi:hypothetical protein